MKQKLHKHSRLWPFCSLLLLCLLRVKDVRHYFVFAAQMDQWVVKIHLSSAVALEPLVR